jgi:hypothetical protein
MSDSEALSFSKPDIALQNWLTETIGSFRLELPSPIFEG